MLKGQKKAFQEYPSKKTWQGVFLGFNPILLLNQSDLILGSIDIVGMTTEFWQASRKRKPGVLNGVKSSCFMQKANGRWGFEAFFLAVKQPGTRAVCRHRHAADGASAQDESRRTIEKN